MIAVFLIHDREWGGYPGAMLALDDERESDAEAERGSRWFPPSAPPYSPTPGEAVAWGAASSSQPQPQPLYSRPPPVIYSYRQYPGVAYGYGSTGAPPHPGQPTFVAQRVGPPPVYVPEVPPPPRRSSPRGYNVAWAFSALARFMVLLVFDTANGALGICGAAIVWSGALLTLATLPLCGVGIVMFHSLLRVVCYLCQADAVLYNVVSDSHRRIVFAPDWNATHDEHESLLPIRIAGRRPLQHYFSSGFTGWIDERPRFEKTLSRASPRSILAAIYFATLKPLLGLGNFAAVGLLLTVVGFLVGDKRVEIRVPQRHAHPFEVYMAALALLIVALLLLHGIAELSKRITRFFCCEADDDTTV